MCLWPSGGSNAHYDKGFEEGFDEGYTAGSIETSLEYEDKLSEWYDMGYYDGKRDVDIDYIVQCVLDEAKHHANQVGEWSVLDAIDITAVYLDGYDPYGYPLPTKQEFEEAVEVLQSYAEFLEWNSKSFKEIARDADPFA